MYIVFGRRKIIMISVSILLAGIVVSASMGVIKGMDVFGVKDGKEFLVVIDAGHGGMDGGAVGVLGTKESDLNLDVAKKLSEILRGKGIDTIMTREDDNGVVLGDSWSKLGDMQARKKIIKESDADLFISIHMNHFTMEKVNGLRVFYSKDFEEAENLAGLIQNSVSKITGAKISNVKAADKSLFLMKSPPMPAILIECGFISNKDEETKLKNPEYRAKIAWAIADSLEKYFSWKQNKFCWHSI